MLTQAAGLAVVAALSPTALLVCAVLLGTANPHRTVLIYLAGAIVMTVIFAVVVFFVLRAGHLQRPQERDPRYGLRLALGVAMLLAGGYLRRRGPKPPDPGKRNKGIVSRLLTRPGGKVAFIIGLIVYTPSLAFVAAVQVVATARSSVTGSVLAIALVVVITLMFAWLPLLFFLVAPGPTGQTLGNFDGWLRAHGYVLTVAGLAIAGVLLTLDGILGVSGVVS